VSKADVDKHFPRNGPCMFHSTRYARHRLIDGIRARHRYGGESVSFLAHDLGRSRAAIKAAINSTPDDNRMTRKEIAEGNQMWKDFAKEMARERRKKKRR
jgi:hypothetical protein